MLSRFFLNGVVLTLSKVHGSRPREPILSDRHGDGPMSRFLYWDSSSTQFYVAMLSISLIVGIPYTGFVVYKTWNKNSSLLNYIRALIIALVCRTFFSLLIATVILLGESSDTPGSNTLLAFECFSINFVFSFWLILTIYLCTCIDCDFNSEPSMKIYNYGIPGIGIFFSLIWIFVMAGESRDPEWIVQIFNNPTYEWVVSTIRLLFLCVQLVLFALIAKKMMLKQTNLDTEKFLILRKGLLMMIALSFLFWMQFSFSVSRPSATNPSPFFYFKYLADGLQCAIACPFLFFFEKWGNDFVTNSPKTLAMDVETVMTRKVSSQREEILVSDKTDQKSKIFTIHSAYSKQALADSEKNAAKDVIYTSIVHPDRLQKTFDFYKRVGILNTNTMTDAAGEEFYECIDDEAIFEKASETAKKDRSSEGDPSNRSALHKSTHLLVDSERNGLKKQPFEPERNNESPNDDVDTDWHMSNDDVAKAENR